MLMWCNFEEALALSCTIFWHLALSSTLRGSADLFQECGIQGALCWSQSRSTSNGCYLLTRTWLWRATALSRGVRQILHSLLSSSDVTTKPNFHTLITQGPKHQREMRSWLACFPPSLGAQEILQLQISVHNAWAPIITVACDVPGANLLVCEREREREHRFPGSCTGIFNDLKQWGMTGHCVLKKPLNVDFDWEVQ